ncbi:MAG: SCO7613 C-terminal domain-containing membrane protein [Mycobacteriales bacterium]
MVAAFVFVSVSWGSLGLFGRTVVLLLVTALTGAVAVETTRRRLTASAEALWAVTEGLLTLDYFAARSYGMAGLDSLGDGGTAVAFGLLALTVGLGVALIARPRLRRELWVGQAFAAVGAWSLFVGVADLLALGPFWSALVVLAVAGGLVVLSVLTRTVLLVVAALVAVVVGYGVAVLVALIDAFSDPSLIDLWTGGGAVEVLAAAAVTIGIGVVVQLWPARGVGRTPRSVVAAAAGALATLELAILVYAPVSQHGAFWATVGVCAVTLAVAAAGLVPGRAWGDGVRVAALASAVLPGLAFVLWAVLAAGTVVSSTTPVWQHGMGARLPRVDGPGSPWAATVAAGGLAIAALLAARWPRMGGARWRTLALPVAGAVAVVGLALQLGLHPIPVIVVAAVVLAAAAVALVVPATRRPDRVNPGPLQAVGLVGVLVASVVPLASQAACLVVWAVAAVLLLVPAWRGRPAIWQPVAAGAAALWATASVVTAADLLGAYDRVLVLVGVAAGAALLLGAQALRGARRPAIEVVGAVVTASALALAAATPLWWQSIAWTAAGVAIVVVSLVSPPRRLLAPVGAAALGVAYVLRLAASDVRVVEAYTLPFATVLLAAGLLALRRNRSLRTWSALGAGLTLALLPSLPSVLADPTTLRGLLLGLGALGLLGAGAVLRWRAPFLMGGLVVAVVVIRNLGPYADAVPRWTLIAAAGLALLVAGVTWESRVRNARAAAAHLRTMR